MKAIEAERVIETGHYIKNDPDKEGYWTARKTKTEGVKIEIKTDPGRPSAATRPSTGVPTAARTVRSVGADPSSAASDSTPRSSTWDVVSSAAADPDETPTLATQQRDLIIKWAVLAWGVRRLKVKPEVKQEDFVAMPVPGDMGDVHVNCSAMRMDFAEVACSPTSRLTAGLINEGFNCQRTNLEQGYDLHKKDDTRRAKEWFNTTCPRKAWFSTPCTYFSLMQNLTPEHKRRPGNWENFLRSRLRARAMNGHCVDMALETLRYDGDIYWEWPYKCSGWSTPELNRFRREAEKIIGRPLRMVRVDARQVGMRDDPGALRSKSWGILTSDENFTQWTCVVSQDFAEDFWAMSALQDYKEQVHGIESGIQKHFKKMPEDSVTLDKDTQHQAVVSLSMPPKLWQTVKLDCFELEVHHRKLFAVLYMDAACKLAVRSVFKELDTKGKKAYFEPSGAQFLISGPGGGFVSNQLREWCGKNAAGIIQSPGEFHSLTADLEVLIRQIKKTARRISLDEPTLSLADCASLACAAHNNQHTASGYAPVQWAHGANHQGYQFAEEARSVATRLRHSIRQKLLSIKIGDWIMYFRRGKNTGSRDSWFGPARVLAIEPKVNLQRERADESASIEDEIPVLGVVSLPIWQATHLRSGKLPRAWQTYQSNRDQVKIFPKEIGVNRMMVLSLETTVQTYVPALEMPPQICLEYLSQRTRMEQAASFTKGANSRVVRTGSRPGQKYLEAWGNLHNQSVAYLKDTTIEREVVEVATDFAHIGAFLQDSTVWLSKRLGDGKATEVAYSKLAPGQQEELTEIDESRLLKMRWVLTYKCQEGGARKPKARLVILGHQHPSLTELSTAAPTLGKLARNMLFQVCAQHKFKLKFGDVSQAFLQTDASEEFESLNEGWRQLRTDQCAWILLDSNNQLKGIIGVRVDDFIIGGDETTKLYGDAEKAIKDIYRWGAWTSGQAEFSGLRVRQFKDFSITLDLYDYTNKFITEAEIDADRKKQAHLPLEPKEISLLRGVLGTASWRAQQVSPQYVVDVGLASSQVNNAKISDLVNANKLVKDMRKSASQVIKFHQFEKYDWHELRMVQWADASDKLRPDGSKTGGLVTGLSTPDFANGSMANVSILGWRSFKLPRKIWGSNNNETQSTAFGDEKLWLSRLMWAELDGVEPTRWKLDDTVKTVPGMLITDSRGIYDAILKSESPQLGMRRFRSGEEARGIKEQILRTDVSFRWVNGLAMLTDSLTKPEYPARHVMEEFLTTQRWKCTFDEMFQSGRRRQRDGKGAFADAPEEADIGGKEGVLDPLESLCDDYFLSDSTRNLMRSRYM
ncbi:unnamed protein product [Prorocentrum cordatum]|uniref:Copia protein n=1 Tax=Prorocentrum cordatum TaxID=2364126 RepID=A0ABN9XDA7_9DINO|nr:unnamed protein product [Polarella glacialis]